MTTNENFWTIHVTIDWLIDLSFNFFKIVIIINSTFLTWSGNCVLPEYLAVVSIGSSQYNEQN